MKVCIVILALVAYAAAETCNADNCSIQDNCRCSSTDGPLSVDETPQLIVLAFVDALDSEYYNQRLSQLVEPRKNPDGDFISATFYVPHEYTDYQIVHDLTSLGFEIGVHSVTNHANQSYWRDATQELLEQEFGDQRKIIAKFANIPIEHITGTLTPQLQLAGDNSINAFESQGFSYDNSWPSKTRFYPYTLDYESKQECDTGSNCPKSSHPGFWIAPIIDLTSDDNDVCATMFACFRNRSDYTIDEFASWLVKQVDSVRDTNKAPLTLIVEKNLFSIESSYDGLIKALDTIQEKYKDVFFVSQARVIEWIKNPVSVADFKTNAVTVDTGCSSQSCQLTKNDGETRYMVSCVPCPKNYPWLDNPEGN